MNTTNEEPKATDNMALLKQQAEGCGAGCSCHTSGVSGKARWGITAIVLIAVGVLVVKAMTKPNAASTQPPTPGFAAPVAAPAAASITAPVVTPEETPAVPEAGTPAAAPGVLAQPAAASVGTPIAGFAELNTIAASSDAVFVYLPGKIATAGGAPTTTMQAAARTLEAQGKKCALFTLQAGSPDYDKLGPQMALPGVLAMVRGKGMSAVSGEITETKLVQGYVAASSAGGCAPAGCGPSGCP
ncbi:MAG: hypothetical protein NTW21_28140 [Verrucomicrobia bacterium]|nr:hypothetical protein [Verrucomicrobiota bacterium]